MPMPCTSAASIFDFESHISESLAKPGQGSETHPFNPYIGSGLILDTLPGALCRFCGWVGGHGRKCVRAIVWLHIHALHATALAAAGAPAAFSFRSCSSWIRSSTAKALKCSRPRPARLRQLRRWAHHRPQLHQPPAPGFAKMLLLDANWLLTSSPSPSAIGTGHSRTQGYRDGHDFEALTVRAQTWQSFAPYTGGWFGLPSGFVSILVLHEVWVMLTP